jgi:hypothetical protein
LTLVSILPTSTDVLAAVGLHTLAPLLSFPPRSIRLSHEGELC